MKSCLVLVLRFKILSLVFSGSLTAEDPGRGKHDRLTHVLLFLCRPPHPPIPSSCASDFLVRPSLLKLPDGEFQDPRAGWDSLVPSDLLLPAAPPQPPPHEPLRATSHPSTRLCNPRGRGTAPSRPVEERLERLSQRTCVVNTEVLQTWNSHGTDERCTRRTRSNGAKTGQRRRIPTVEPQVRIWEKRGAKGRRRCDATGWATARLGFYGRVDGSCPLTPVTWKRRTRWTSRSNLPHGNREMPAAGTQPPMQFHQVYGNWQSYPYQPHQEAMQHEAMRNFMHRGMVDSRGTELSHVGHWNFNSQPAFQGQLDRREQAAHLDLSLNLAIPRPVAAPQQIDSPFHSYARVQGHNLSFNQQAMPHQGLQLFPLPHQGLQGACHPSAGQDGFVHPELVARVQDQSRYGAVVGKSFARMQTEPLVGKAIEQPWRPLLPTYQSKGSQGESRQLLPATHLNLQSDEPRPLHQRMESERRKKVCKRSPTQEMRALLRLFNAIFTQDTLVGRDLNRYTEGQIKRYLERLGFSVGTFPITMWGCPGGQYQGLACVLSWILSAVHSKKGYVIVVSEEQAEEAVPYRPGSPYVADTAVLLEMGMLEYKWPFPFSWSILTVLRSVYDYKGRESSASKNGQVKEEDVVRVLRTCFPSMTGFGAVMTGHFVVSEDPHIVEKAAVASINAPPYSECELPESTIDGHREEASEVVLEVSCDSVKSEGGCFGKSKATGGTAESQTCSMEAGVTENNTPCAEGKVFEVALPSSCAAQGADNIAEALAGEDLAPDTSAGTVGKIAPSMVPSVTPLAPAG